MPSTYWKENYHKGIIMEYFLDHGLTETTETDQQCFDECMANVIPFTAAWENLDDSMKIMAWDSEWEKYLKHRAELIEYEGWDEYLPWNLYKSLDLKWMDGYNYIQTLGDCCGHAHKNSLKVSNLVNAHRTGRTPREFALSVTYGIARGNGRMSHGSGCNLNPMSKWSATVGNYWASDFGKYDGGRYIDKYRKGLQHDKNALKTQSLIIYLPNPNFEFCYAACAAGFGINIGTNIYPTGSKVNADGLAQASAWKSGAHAVALIAAFQGKSGRRYVFMENSHGAKYSSDSLSPNRQWGCWCDENDIKRMATERFGRWYCQLGEMG